MYHSTRSRTEYITAGEAIIRGLAADGGLFVPDEFPLFDSDVLGSMTVLDYQARAGLVLRPLLADYTPEQLSACLARAYGQGFDTKAIAPLRKLDDDSYVLELWHGPTSAFKDMALQLLPHLLSTAFVNHNEREDIVILVATSGDTGKAALEGFRDVDHIKIIAFFPENGVSEIQRLQMVTQEGSNTFVVAVRGNFDDAQSGVKAIFANADFAASLGRHNYQLSSANSINWGRLAPQIVYYFSAYADWLTQSGHKAGACVNFVVPTGNFGDILAGYYARCMGLPINKLICASNQNNVLTDFLHSGCYDRRRTFYKTISPSMDILISSNLERLLYSVTAGDTDRVRNWMDSLNTTGSYKVDADTLHAIHDLFWGGWADEAATMATIKKVYGQNGYVLDTHTAVAYNVMEQYRQDEACDGIPCIVLSTASPFKFSSSVCAALLDGAVGSDGMAAAMQLSTLTGWQLPPGLAGLDRKPCRHNVVCDKADMQASVRDLLAIVD